MALCKCDNLGLGNTGLPNCQSLIGVDTKLYLVPTINSDGVRNFHDGSTTFDQTYLDGKINEADASKRWYPLPLVENQTSERAENVTETSAAGTVAFIKEGVRTESFELWNQTPTYIKALEAAKCTDFSVYAVDDNGNFVGMELNEDGNLYPIRIDRGSFSAIYVKKTPTLTAKVVISWQWSQLEKDSNLSMVSASDITADVLGAIGLLDIFAEYSSITTDGFVVTLDSYYGAVNNKFKDQGLVVGDFTLFNDTQSAAVTITSVTEAPNGTYTFVIPTQTSADSLTLTPSKNGRDYTVVVDSKIVIP